MRRTWTRRVMLAVLAGLALVAAACGQGPTPGPRSPRGEGDAAEETEENAEAGDDTAADPDPETLRLYTRVTENTVEAVVAGFEDQQPDLEVEVFRAPAARDAVENGSPVGMAWPEPGAIAVYSPIAVLAESDAGDAAEAFVDYVLTAEAHEAIAATGWQPVRDDVEWEHQGGPLITPDWTAAFDRQEELLEEYRSVFGG